MPTKGSLRTISQGFWEPFPEHLKSLEGSQQPVPGDLVMCGTHLPRCLGL